MDYISYFAKMHMMFFEASTNLLWDPYRNLILYVCTVAAIIWFLKNESQRTNSKTNEQLTVIAFGCQCIGICLSCFYFYRGLDALKLSSKTAYSIFPFIEGLSQAMILLTVWSCLSSLMFLGSLINSARNFKHKQNPENIMAINCLGLGVSAGFVALSSKFAITLIKMREQKQDATLTFTNATKDGLTALMIPLGIGLCCASIIFLLSKSPFGKRHKG
ncbi:MAG: hypothetical protein NT027_19410 [Proteobacteria bacterium]|nr:hypothetical protein [Pseudomonadota bacterium]